jgi:hypothetical protein
MWVYDVVAGGGIIGSVGGGAHVVVKRFYRASLLGRLLAFVFLAAGAAGLLGLEGRERGEVDLLLGGSPDQVLVGVHEVLADLDVSLVDQNAGLVDGLGLEALLVDAGLQTLVQELVDGETEHVIELQLLAGEETVAVHSVEEGSAFEESAGVLLLQSEQFSGGLAEVGEQQVDSPDLALVLQAVLAYQLQLVVDSLLLEGATWGVERRRV